MPAFTREQLEQKKQQLLQSGLSPTFVDDKIQREIQRGRIQLADTAGGQEPKSFRGFVGNVGEDIGRNVAGIASLPGLVFKSITQPQTLPETGRAIGEGVVDEYSNLIRNPVQTTYERPISTLLNVLPFAQAGKAALAGRAGKAGVAGKIAGSVDEAADVGRVARAAGVAGKADDVARAGTKTGFGTKAVQEFGESAAARVHRASPSMFDRAAQQGIDINRTISKITPGKGVRKLEDYVGDVSSRGKGGIINQRIQQAEGQIQDFLSKQGDEIAVGTDELLQPLLKRQTEMQRIPGMAGVAENLAEFIDDTRRLYPEGLTAKEALDLKRVFDDEFGRAVADETTGSTTAVAQKMLANQARGILKDRYSPIREALDLESELYTIRPILNRARAVEKTQGSTIRRGSLAAVDLTKPATVTDLVTENPRISSLMSKLQEVGRAEGAVPTSTRAGRVAQGARQVAKPTPAKVAAGAAVGRQQQPAPAEGQVLPPSPSNAPAGMTQDNLITNQLVAQGQLPAKQAETFPQGAVPETPANALFGNASKQQVIAAAAQAGADVDDLKDISELYDLTSAGGDGGRALPATQVANLGDIQNSVATVDSLKPFIQQNEDIMGPIQGNIRKRNPYDTTSQVFDAQMRTVSQIVGRAMEGGVLRKEDEEKYRRMLPQITDTPEVARGKIEVVKEMLKLQRQSREQAFQEAGFSSTGEVSQIDALNSILPSTPQGAF